MEKDALVDSAICLTNFPHSRQRAQACKIKFNAGLELNMYLVKMANTSSFYLHTVEDQESFV